MARLDVGFCEVANPFNRHQVRRVSLVPKSDNGIDGVDALVFWTRNPKHILAHADELTQRGYRYYVMVTITGYPKELEPSITSPAKICAAVRELALKIGPERVVWRYDPIFMSSITGADFHRRNFHELAQNMAGSVKRVIVSLYKEYRGAKQRIDAMERQGVLKMGQHDATGLAALFGDLAESARAAGMEIQSCAEETSLEPYGIKNGACIDAALINNLWGLEFKGKDKNQRAKCLCCQSVDIGAYSSCNLGCVYCYAW